MGPGIIVFLVVFWEWHLSAGIGHGIDHVDLAKLGATVCYTLDGQGAGEIDTETFSADLATVTIRGVMFAVVVGCVSV